MDERRVSAMIAALYDAALDPSGWDTIASRLASTLAAGSCAVQLRDPRTDSVKVLSVTENITEEAVRSYEAHYCDIDPWVSRAAALPIGKIRFSEELIASAEFARTEIYTDFARSRDIFSMIGSIVPLSASGETGLLGVHRPRSAESFGAAEAATLELILPHLQRALQIRSRFAALERERLTSLAALEALTLGVLVVDGGGKIEFANRAAEALLQPGDGLVSAERRIDCVRRGEAATLRAAIRGAALAGGGAVVKPGGVVAVSRQGGRPLSVLVCPAPPATFAALRGPIAILFLADPDSAPTDIGRHIARLYGLSPSETRLVAGLLRGETLSAYAERAGTSVNTVKTQLSHVFAKTGANRQAELVRQLLSDPIIALAGN